MHDKVSIMYLDRSKHATGCGSTLYRVEPISPSGNNIDVASHPCRMGTDCWCTSQVPNLWYHRVLELVSPAGTPAQEIVVYLSAQVQRWKRRRREFGNDHSGRHLWQVGLSWPSVYPCWHMALSGQGTPWSFVSHLNCSRHRRWKCQLRRDPQHACVPRRVGRMAVPCELPMRYRK